MLEAFSRVDGIIINDHEARLLAGGNVISCGKEILDYGPKFCVIKKGEHGSILFFSDGTVIPFPAFPLENVVDPTGAGDSFAGGFLGFLSSTDLSKLSNLKQAMAWGTVMGSIAVESLATRSLELADFAAAKTRYRAYREFLRLEDSFESE